MRVPSSPKSRTPSPSSTRSARPYLRPLLLANRARTTLPRPPFKYNPQRARISSPRLYKMTKSVRSDPRQLPEQTELVVPEITVTPPAPTPEAWAQGAQIAVASVGSLPDVPPRTSSRGATTSYFDHGGFDSFTPPTQYNDPRLLAPPHEKVSTASPTSPTKHIQPTPSDYLPSHCVPPPDRRLAPHALRRVGNVWDFMPNIQFPGRRTPISNPSRQRIAIRHANDTVGRAL